MSALNENTVGEFKGQIIDTLEDFLTFYGITPDMLPNEERDNDDPIFGAIIFGSDYGDLSETIQHELDIYELVGRENPINNPFSISMIVRHIYEGYEEIINKIQPAFPLSEDNARYLRQEITDTLRNWEVIE